jgi:hypothetical protein
MTASCGSRLAACLGTAVARVEGRRGPPFVGLKRADDFGAVPGPLVRQLPSRQLWKKSFSSYRSTEQTDQTLAPPVANRAIAATAIIVTVSHPRILATAPFA